MASFQEIENTVRAAQGVLDQIRHKAIVDIANLTGRNVIAYYSAFMTRHCEGTEINDMGGNCKTR